MWERAIVATSADIEDAVGALPAGLQDAPSTLASVGAIGAVVVVHGWLIVQRQFRRLALVELSLLGAFALSRTLGEAILEVQRPEVIALFEDLPDGVARTLPTNPVVAAVVAALVLVRPWIPAGARSTVWWLTAVWLIANAAITDAPPYLGLVLDVGSGMVAGSLIALALRTPNLQPDRDAIIAGLALAGLDVADLAPASVDARGSEPWIGTARDGRPLFVKALSSDQRAADLLFRAVRWVRLRRTGDAPPEISLKRAAEHEAMIAHHARSLGIRTPRLLAVAVVGPRKVALAYEGLAGRSLDRVPRHELTDEVLGQLWGLVSELRRHRIAHRDLRLGNAFLGDDGDVSLIDFGFGELAASRQALDTDVAELLAATSAVVGIDRAVQVAAEQVGLDVLDAARDWLHPLAFSAATRADVDQTDTLEPLRSAVNHLTGHTATEYEPLGRLSGSRLLALFLVGVGAYSLLMLGVHDDIADAAGDLDIELVVVAALIGALTPPLIAASFQSTLRQRLRFQVVLRAAVASEAPIFAPTAWSFANRVLSDAVRNQGISATSAKHATAGWTVSGLASAPLLVAGFAAAGLRTTNLETVALGLGAAIGVGVAATELALLRLSPHGKELTRVWIDPYLEDGRIGTGIHRGALLWGAGLRTVQGVAFAVAARASGVDTEFESLVAIGIAGLAIAALLPAPGGVGAVELLTFFGLLLSAPSAIAVLGAVVARIVLFWVHVPFAAVAYRSERRSRDRRRERVEEPSRFGSFDPSTAQASRGSWWT